MMEKTYIIKDVFTEQYYVKDSNPNIPPHMGGGIATFWDEKLIKFAQKEDAEDVITHKKLNNVIIIEVYTT